MKKVFCIAVYCLIISFLHAQKLEFKTYDLTEFSMLKNKVGDDDPIKFFKTADTDWQPIGPRASNLAPYLMSYAPSADEYAVFKRKFGTAKVTGVISAIGWSLGFVGYMLDDEDTLNGKGWDYAINGAITTGLITGVWSYFSAKSADKRLNRSIDLYNAQF